MKTHSSKSHSSHSHHSRKSDESTVAEEVVKNSPSKEETYDDAVIVEEKKDSAGISASDGPVPTKECPCTSVVNCFKSALKTATEKIKLFSILATKELQNPIVIWNLVFGTATAVLLFNGTLSEKSMGIRDRSKQAACAARTAVSALLVADILLSTKYYSKFDKSN